MSAPRDPSSPREPAAPTPPSTPAAQGSGRDRGQSLPNIFLGSAASGASSTLSDMSRAFTAANMASASRQASQLLSVMSHPVSSAAALAAAAQRARETADVPPTVAAASGDMVGSAAVVVGTGMAATAAAAPAYMRTQPAQQLARRFSAAASQISPMLSGPRLARFVATRPLALAMGAASAALAAVGSASGRESTAAENAQQHPEVSAALAPAQLDVLLASPVSRIVRSASQAGPQPPPATALSPMQPPPAQPRPSLSAMPPPPSHSGSEPPEPPDFF